MLSFSSSGRLSFHIESLSCTCILIVSMMILWKEAFQRFTYFLCLYWKFWQYCAIEILYISCNVRMLSFQRMWVCPFYYIVALLFSFRVASF
jgi:hypothetical protein